MVKLVSKLLAIGFITMFLLPLFTTDVYAETQWSEEEMIDDVPTSKEEEKSNIVAVNSPSDCIYQKAPSGKMVLPVNCLFLEEPIGGKPNYDLYLETCIHKDGETKCTLELWGGGAIKPSTDKKTVRGPIQAILTFDPDKPYQGPFGLLYNYLGLIYTYMSGLIIAIAVLFTVVGGIQMTTAGGDTAKFDAGKSRISKAVVGIILWFTASLILYTINPTFFAF